MPYLHLVVPNGRRRTTRTLRAMWRDTSALWKEFRRPILAFLIAVLGGGWLYGELLVVAGYPRVPDVDLPYMMIALMILESFTEIPPEPYLIAFWYIMPLIALYVVVVIAVGSVLTYLWVELPTGASGEKRRSAWAGVLGLFAAIPIVYLVLVLLFQIVKPLFGRG